jgi:hypothetical protein
VVMKKVEDGCKLNNQSAELRDGKLVVRTAVDYFQELVIGPAGQLGNDWYDPD